MTPEEKDQFWLLLGDIDQQGLLVNNLFQVTGRPGVVVWQANLRRPGQASPDGTMTTEVWGWAQGLSPLAALAGAFQQALGEAGTKVVRRQPGISSVDLLDGPRVSSEALGL